MIIRNIEEDVKTGLEALASEHGWTIEEEVHQILRQAMQTWQMQGAKARMSELIKCAQTQPPLPLQRLP